MCAIAYIYSIIGLSIPPYYNVFKMFLAGAGAQCPADNVLPIGNTGLHSDIMWCNGGYVMCHNGGIGVHGLHLNMLPPIVGDIQMQRCTANLPGLV
jgi:hypothetical protein